MKCQGIKTKEYIIIITVLKSPEQAKDIKSACKELRKQSQCFSSNRVQNMLAYKILTTIKKKGQ